jgi:hypothetical protein
MREHTTPDPDERIMDWLGLLAEAKNRTVAPAVYATYAKLLAPYPTEAVHAAILAIAADTSEFFPPAGRIIAEAGRWLRGGPDDTGPAPILSPEGAWRLARATISAYQPQTRPYPSSGNPAVDGALREMGGVRACQWEDTVGEGIIKRGFLGHYERLAATPAHIGWALAGGPRETPVIPGVEIPAHEIARWAAEARTLGRELPEPIARAASGQTERAAVLDGRDVAYPVALPAPLAAPLDPERRRTMAESVKAGIARLAAGMRMPR